ncbi:hypothetical protein SOVF_010960 [Spinacia oleracea]|nr:hypothetical protein SOVF_010960 [Spinacia oleracea]
MFTASKEIKKERGVNPTDLEENLAQSIFDLETNNKDMGTELKDLFINSVAEVDISNNKKAIVVHSKYDSSEVDGAHIEKALRIQCSTLYKHRRERLKAAYFSKSRNLKEVERACPATIDLAQWRWLIYSYWNLPKQRERSEKNRANALSKKIRSACGAKSIARKIYELELEAEAGSNEREEENEATNASSSNATTSTTQSNGVPMYLKLWEKTKRHKNGKFDDEAEIKYNEFKQLHEKEVGEKGADNVSVDVAYEKVLGYRPGYARGLGKGHPVLSKGRKKGRADLEVTVVQLQNENNTMRAVSIIKMKL